MTGFPEKGAEGLAGYLAPEFSDLLTDAVKGLEGTTASRTVKPPDREPVGMRRLHDVREARLELEKFLKPMAKALEDAGDVRRLFHSARTPEEIARRFALLDDIPEVSAATIQLATTRTEVRGTIFEIIDVEPVPDPKPGPIGPGPGGDIPRPQPKGGGIGGHKPVRRHETFVLRPYTGPSINTTVRKQLLALRRVLMRTPERTFRLGAIRAEAHMVRGTYPGAIEEYEELLGEDLSNDQRTYAAVRCGVAHLSHGDARFRRTRRPGERDRTLAAQAYDAAIRVVADNGVAEDDSAREQIERHAQVQKAKLDAGFNYIGYRDSYVPVLRPETLEELAANRIRLADDAISRFEVFTAKADEISDRLADLDFEQDIKAAEEEIAQKQIDRTRDQEKIATTRVEQIEEQLDGLDITSAVGAAGFVLRGVASGALAGGPPDEDGNATQIGTSLPGVAGALSGLASTAASYFSRSEDLRRQREIARIERRIAKRDVEIAELQADISSATMEFLGDKIERIQNRELNPQLYYAAAEEFRGLAERHLAEAVRWAFLFERSVAFLRLSDLSGLVPFDFLPLRQEDKEGNTLTAAARLARVLADLVDVNVPITKFEHLTETYSLRTLHPLEFAQFQQTSEMDFTISLYEQNKLRPGVFRQRIKGVEVEPVGLVPTTGYAGTLTHHGSFILRDRDTTPEPGKGRFVPTDGRLAEAFEALGDGAAQGVAVDGVMVFLVDEDTTQLSADKPPPNIGDPDPKALNLFEGYGPAGHWHLELRNIDLRNIADVRLRITYVIPETDRDLGVRVEGLVADYEQELLADDVLAPQGDALDLITPFPLGRDFPAVLDQLASGEAELALSRGDFPSGVTGLRLKTVVAQALDGDRRGVEGVGLQIARDGTALDLERVTFDDGFTEELGADIPLLASDDRFPVEGTYTLRLTDPSRADGIDELILFFVYEFQEGDGS